MYEYRCKVNKIIDGDTIDVDIDLGFGVWMMSERVRVMGIDTPESRTSDKVEDLFGEAAKARVRELLTSDEYCILKTEIDKNGEDMKGKFGRVLGDFIIDEWEDEPRTLTNILIEEGHAVAYLGGSKEEIRVKHLANRKKLLREGVVNQKAYNALMDTGE